MAPREQLDHCFVHPFIHSPNIIRVPTLCHLLGAVRWEAHKPPAHAHTHTHGTHSWWETHGHLVTAAETGLLASLLLHVLSLELESYLTAVMLVQLPQQLRGTR